MYLFLNGKFLPAEKAKISPFDHGFLYGDGVYETLRTYEGKIWQINEHLARLEHSARELRLRFPYSKATFKNFLNQLVEINKFPETRLRLTITRGVNKGDFLTCFKPTILITAEKLKPEPESIYQEGVKIISVPFMRPFPHIKSTSLLPFILAQQQKAEKKAYEAIFLTYNNYVTEGTITNIFMVKKNILYTPKSNILKGTTRQALLKLAEHNNIEARITDFTLQQLYQADEIFITNAPRGIIPVHQFDHMIIGKPGPITKKLSDLFFDYSKSTFIN